MGAQEYIQASRYEHLIRNAFDCQRGSRHGADVSYMENLMNMEQGKIYSKHIGSFSKQFPIVRDYISKALIKLSKIEPYSDESTFFLGLNEKLIHSSSTADLMEVVNISMDKVIEMKKEHS